MEANDITKIIKACKDAGVEKIAFEGVSIDFFKPDPKQEIVAQSDRYLESMIEQKVYEDFLENQQTNKPQKPIPDEPVNDDLICIDDPLAWEEMELAKLDQAGGLNGN